MPISVVAQAGVIAISMAVVAAIVVYENPEVRRMADNLKQRIAIAVQTMGDNMHAEARRRNSNTADAEDEDEPVFNRPEDAEGFLMSRGRRDGEPGVVADEATRRRQREELLYWNRQQLQRQQAGQTASTTSTSASTSTSWQPREALEAVQNATREVAAAAGISLPSFINQPFGQNAQSQSAQNGPSTQPYQSPARPNTSFDQFLRPDTTAADRGSYVMNSYSDDFGTSSSSNINSASSGTELLRRRRPEAVAASYANPFADEYGIELDDEEFARQIQAYEEAGRPKPVDPPVAPPASPAHGLADRSDTMSDIYSATEPDTNRNDAVFDPLPVISEQQAPSVSGTTSEVFFDADHEMSASTVSAISAVSAIHPQAFDSIQAWAQHSSSASLAGFYSPLPVTPTEAMSEPSVISSVGDGELTPTGSMSIIGSVAGSDAGSEAGFEPVSAVSGSSSGSAAGSVAGSAPSVIDEPADGDYGVVSDDSDGIMTPTSWSDVGSVVSENDAVLHA